MVINKMVVRHLLMPPLPDGRKTYGDMIEDTQSRPEEILDLKDQKEVFNRLFLLYCKSLADSTAEPPRELALFYARIFTSCSSRQL